MKQLTLQTALAQFVRSQTTLDWDEWFALVLAAHKEPHQWRETWASLESTDRKALLALLRKDAGPLSDYILRSIVHNTPTDSDDPLLELARDDAADAMNRQLERLGELKRTVEEDERSLSQVLESYTAIEQLRSKVQRLREEIAQDSELAERHSLEKDIYRLSTYKESLLSRDWDERRAEKQRLIDETDSLRTKKNELEDAIRQAREDRFTAEKKLDEVQREWDQEQARLQELRTQIHDLENRLDQTSGKLNTMSRKLKEIIGGLFPFSHFRSGRG